MLYLAPREHYYAHLLPDVEAAFASANAGLSQRCAPRLAHEEGVELVAVRVAEIRGVEAAIAARTGLAFA
jgi:hypothetical protein